MALSSFCRLRALKDFFDPLLEFDLADFTESVDFPRALAELVREAGLFAC